MIVSTFFGKIKHDYSDFQIDDNDLNILRDIFKDSKQISFSNYINIKDDENYNIFLKKIGIIIKEMEIFISNLMKLKIGMI